VTQQHDKKYNASKHFGADFSNPKGSLNKIEYGTHWNMKGSELYIIRRLIFTKDNTRTLPDRENRIHKSIFSRCPITLT
jgi:hypothetical protein